jgi:hypothetical protein
VTLRRFRRFSDSLSLELDDDDDDDESESELDALDDDESESESELEESELESGDDDVSSAASAAACCMMSLGALRKCSRKSSVNPPRPMEVKKLMANRVFLGLSLGNRPSKSCCMVGSRRRVLSFARPKNSAISWNRILMKIRLDDVVSSSLRWMKRSTDHGRASECSKCEKSLATLRSLLVSNRWMVEYCSRKHSVKPSW